jgi:arginine decarboxylase
MFLVGAYQEILGDLHNLFGDTHAVHVRIDEDGGYHVQHVVEGEEVRDVLRYVSYEPRELREKVRQVTESALRRGDVTLEDAKRLREHYDSALGEYTYLSQDD